MQFSTDSGDINGAVRELKAALPLKIIQPAKGHRGARQIASAFAELHLRRLGYLPPERINHGSGRAWTEADYDTAQAMRLRKATDEQIAALLSRPLSSVKKALA